MPIFEKGKRRQALEKHVIKIKQVHFFQSMSDLLLTSNRSVTIIELPNGYFDEGDNYGRFAQGL